MLGNTYLAFQGVPSRFDFSFHPGPGKEPNQNLNINADEFRERGFNRLLLPIGDHLRPVDPLAHHLLFPTQVLYSPRNRRSIEAVLREAKVREAEGVLVFSKKDGWSIHEVED